MTIPVLSYPSGPSGWTDDLTTFHEEVSDGNYFIDVASRQHTLSAIARRMPSDSAVIMDIGCSSGYMIRDLRARFPKATMPGIPLVQFDLVQCPLPDACVDVLVLLNVLKHIENDAAAAKQIYRLLRPGGTAVIEVPAGPDLYDVYDKLLLHHRRYTGAQIEGHFARRGIQDTRKFSLGLLSLPVFPPCETAEPVFLERKAPRRAKTDCAKHHRECRKRPTAGHSHARRSRAPAVDADALGHSLPGDGRQVKR